MEANTGARGAVGLLVVTAAGLVVAASTRQAITVPGRAVVVPPSGPVSAAATVPAAAPAWPADRDLDRDQIAAALAVVTGPGRATLGARLQPLAAKTAASRDSFDERLYELGEQLHFFVIDRAGTVDITFPGGPVSAALIDDALTAKWGRPERQSDASCALWVDPIRQRQVSRCDGNDMVSDQVTIESAAYLTAAQWVGRAHQPLGIEPFRLIGASRARIEAVFGAPAVHDRGVGWSVPRIGPRFAEPTSVWIGEGDPVDHWEAYVESDPAPIAKLLVAKYGAPIAKFGDCSTAAGGTPMWGSMVWVVDRQRIEATCNGYSVTLRVDDERAFEARGRESWAGLASVAGP